MSYAIIGSARSARLLLRRLPEAASKYPLQPLATRKALHPPRPRSDPRSFPKTGGSRQGDVVFLAVRFESHRDVAKALPTWKGKTIIDVTNAYGVPPEKLGGQPSSRPSRRLSLVQDWLRASTIWSLPS